MAALACALMIGCSDGADPGPDDPSTSEAASSPTPSASAALTPSASAEDTESEAESDAESGSESEGSESTGTEGTVASRTLAIEQRHPNGSVLRLTSMDIEATSITVGIEVVNGSTRAFGLSAGGNVVALTDDLGGVYEFIKPPDNPGLDIQPRGTLTGELVYFGVVNPEATTLLLQTNIFLSQPIGTVYDTATEAPNELYPHFSVEIPLAP